MNQISFTKLSPRPVCLCALRSLCVKKSPARRRRSSPTNRQAFFVLFLAVATFLLPSLVDSQEAAPSADKVAAAPDNLVKLSQTGEIWLDTKRKAVVVDGQVCLREGQLEMFACTKGTKEHESIVSVNCQAEEVHAGLLAAGAKPGTPVSFDPQYKAATGQIIDVYVLWKDPQGEKHQARAQDWIRDIKTQQAMKHDWVFAGSGFWRDPETGKEHYKAGGGDLICVSNFPTATLDLPIESSQANDNLMFEAFADRIPPRNTKVRLVLIPRRLKTND